MKCTPCNPASSCCRSSRVRAGGTYLVVGRLLETRIQIPFAIAGPGDFTLSPGIRVQPFPPQTSSMSLLIGQVRPTAIVRLGLNNEEVSRIPLDSPPSTTFRKALVDADGSLIVLLNTSRHGLPLVNPLFPLAIPPLPESSRNAPPNYFGYLMKTNPRAVALSAPLSSVARRPPWRHRT